MSPWRAEKTPMTDTQSHIRELRAAGMRLADSNQQDAVSQLAAMAVAQEVIRELQAKQDDIELELERLREALSPSACDLAEHVRQKAKSIRRVCVGPRLVLEALADLMALADEIELVEDGLTEEDFRRDCNGCLALDEQTEKCRVLNEHLLAETDMRKTADSRLSTAKTEIAQAKGHLRGALSFIQGVEITQMAKEVTRCFHHNAVALEEICTKRDDALRDLEKLRKKQLTITSIDKGVGPDYAVIQNVITFSCPAGCKHSVVIPEGASSEEAGKAIEEATKLFTWTTAGGALAWTRHQPATNSVVLEDGPPPILFKDALKVARKELGCLQEVDEEEAWGLQGNKARDIWISGAEEFMCAVLAWIEGVEKRQSDARSALPVGLPLDCIGAALMVLLGHADLNQNQTKETP